MGCWSVYCGLSNISITEGHKCVLLPLKKNNRYEGYLTHLPATLPIFGEYDDYGGIVNIEKNENTEFIEKYFDCTIEEFCEYFTDNDSATEKLSNNKEIEKWKFMFIDRNVYDFLSTHNFNYDNSHPYGNTELLKKIGAEYIGNFPEKDSRYCHFWNINDAEFKSDGQWLHTIRDTLIISLSDIQKHLSDEAIEILKKPSYRLWNIYDDEYQAQHYFWIIGIDGSTYVMNKYLREVMIENPNLNFKLHKTEGEDGTIAEKYTENFKIFGDYFADLCIIRDNLYCFSKTFEPYTQYITPQCGEFKSHQKILEKFLEINKSYIIK